jgi:hypothetical protein
VNLVIIFVLKMLRTKVELIFLRKRNRSKSDCHLGRTNAYRKNRIKSNRKDLLVSIVSINLFRSQILLDAALKISRISIMRKRLVKTKTN